MVFARPRSMALQVVVFDLEFGQPAASSSLPASRPPFRDILGCFGHQAIAKDVTQGGIDLLYCSHQVRCCTSQHHHHHQNQSPTPYCSLRCCVKLD